LEVVQVKIIANVSFTSARRLSFFGGYIVWVRTTQKVGVEDFSCRLAKKLLFVKEKRNNSRKRDDTPFATVRLGESILGQEKRGPSQELQDASKSM
jgi:hypothetical protein